MTAKNEHFEGHQHCRQMGLGVGWGGVGWGGGGRCFENGTGI